MSDDDDDADVNSIINGSSKKIKSLKFKNHDKPIFIRGSIVLNGDPDEPNTELLSEFIENELSLDNNIKGIKTYNNFLEINKNENENHDSDKELISDNEDDDYPYHNDDEEEYQTKARK